MPHRKPELQTILKDLRKFIDASCRIPTGDEHTFDFVGDKCNDAALMLQEALAELEATKGAHRHKKV